MDTILGEIVGNISIDVYKVNNESRLFHLQADNEDVLPTLDIIEDTLKMY